MHGPLSEIGLIEVLQLLERGRRSGRLRVIGPVNSVPHTLRIRDGLLVAIEPDADDAALTKALIRRAEMAPGDSPDLDPVPIAHREAVRERLARQALVVMLHWDHGRFDFEAGPVPDGPLSWSSDALVLDLVATESRRAELREALDEWRLIVERCPADRMPPDAPVSLEALDWRIIDAANGLRDVAALAAHLVEPIEEVGARLRVLEAAAILHLRHPEPEVRQSGDRAPPLDSPEQSIERLRARLRHVPGDGMAWRALGLAEVGAGHFDRAVAAWTAWQEAVPADAETAQALVDAAHTMMEALRESRD
ncbi:MAG TPA: DUF4388 domain-containing protein [Gemmatimonadales bacterium]|nr:DUF4388 domain-containing protein [Gemmatimonadales bacterium]